MASSRQPAVPAPGPGASVAVPVAGLLLTGGASRRMGRDKATIVLPDGRTCAQTVAGCLSEVARPVLEVGPGVSGLAAVADELPLAGPLAALATGWDALVAAGHAGPVLVVACDLPDMTGALLGVLARFPGDGTVVPVVGGRAQPLCARLGASAMSRCRGLVDAGHRSMRALLDVTPVTWAGPDVWSEVAEMSCFADVDTPDDLARALARGGGRSAGRAAVPGHPDFPHLDERGSARMIDVTAKDPTVRRAVARCTVRTTADVTVALAAGEAGLDPVQAAKVAGIQGAKQTSALLPLCHPIRLTDVRVDVVPRPGGVDVVAVTEVVDRTGVEMEALTACAVAGLTLVCALSTADPAARIDDLTLWLKKGGRSGRWERQPDQPGAGGTGGTAPATHDGEHSTDGQPTVSQPDRTNTAGTGTAP